MTKRNHPSFGRKKSARGLDQFDTPPIASSCCSSTSRLAGVKSVCEPFSGKGNLVIAMRRRGLIVHASDIEDRGCPDSIVLDFLVVTDRPPDCDVLCRIPLFSRAMEIIEHAWALGFRVVILLLKIEFLNTEERYERMHKRGHLRRVCPFAERLQDVHDAKHLAAGGKKGSQSQDHGWFAFDRNYCGHATTIPVSINDATARMPWSSGDPACEQCAKPYQPRRSSSGSARSRASNGLIASDVAYA